MSAEWEGREQVGSAERGELAAHAAIQMELAEPAAKARMAEPERVAPAESEVKAVPDTLRTVGLAAPAA